jgi:hypothetical protein
MKRTQLVLIVAGIAALALGGTALASRGGGAHGPRAAGGASDHRRGHHDGLATAASYLGTSVDSLLTQLRSGTTLAQVADATSGKSASGLVDALVAHEKQELADAVAAGRLTQAQADGIAATLKQRVTDAVNGVRPPCPGPRHAGGLQAASTYLGITVESLIAQLRSGKTLAQVANATSGTSASGLIDALVADATARFGSRAPADLRRRITELVNRALPALGPRGRHHREHPGFGGRRA